MTNYRMVTDTEVIIKGDEITYDRGDHWEPCRGVIGDLAKNCLSGRVFIRRPIDSSSSSGMSKDSISKLTSLSDGELGRPARLTIGYTNISDFQASERIRVAQELIQTLLRA